MSSSSDIEKLFDHFGGDASAYQEISRENEARSARTRWPLLVTLDLTQPQIPAITPRREPAAAGQAGEPVQQSADAGAERMAAKRNDATPVGRARPPLFARPHRRDIPPVGAAVQPAAPRGGARFATVAEAASAADAAQEASTAAARIEAAPVAAAVATPAVPPVAPLAQAAAPLDAPATPALRMFAPIPPVVSATPATPIQRAAPALAPQPAVPAAAAFQTRFQAPAQAAPTQPASILGKLFTVAEPAPVPAQPAAAPGASVPLLSVFDRLRGHPGPAASSIAEPALAPAPHSWLTNGPRRS